MESLGFLSLRARENHHGADSGGTQEANQGPKYRAAPFGFALTTCCTGSGSHGGAHTATLPKWLPHGLPHFTRVTSYPTVTQG